MIFQRKPWILRGTTGYHMVEQWNYGEGGNDKMEKKEETENRPLEEGEQSMVSGLEGVRRYVCLKGKG